MLLPAIQQALLDPLMMEMQKCGNAPQLPPPPPTTTRRRTRSATITEGTFDKFSKCWARCVHCRRAFGLFKELVKLTAVSAVSSGKA